MPIYQFKSESLYDTEEGPQYLIIEKLFKRNERPDFIILEDGSKANFIIAPIARLERNWSSFAKYGTGVYNKTLKRWITSDLEHDKISEQLGLHKITKEDFDQISRIKSQKDDQLLNQINKQKKYQEVLNETKDVVIANDIVYGEEEHQIAKQATDAIFEKYPVAKPLKYNGDLL